MKRRRNPISDSRKKFLFDKYLKQKLKRMEEVWENLNEEQIAQLTKGERERLTVQFEFAALADPTKSGEYVDWIIKHVLLMNIRIEEDWEKLNEDLLLYHERKRRGVVPLEFRDINRLHPEQFYQWIDLHGGKLSNREAFEAAASQQDVVFKKGKFKVLKVTDWQAAKRLAADTSWCVRGTNMAQDYCRAGPLFFFLYENEPFALLTNDPERHQFMDVYDQPISIEEIEKDEVQSSDPLDRPSMKIDGLKEALMQVSDWVVCQHCEKVTLGQEMEPDQLKSKLERLIQHYRFQPISIVKIRAGSFVAAEIEIDNNWKIMIGPAVIVKKLQNRFPPLEEFARRAGFDSDAYLFALIERIRQAACLHREEDLKEHAKGAFHAFFVMSPCEDFPACGHEPSPQTGAPTCWPRFPDSEGVEVGSRCDCGAFVPSGFGHSLCKTCLEKGQYERFDDETYEEPDDDDDRWDSDFPNY